MKKPFATTGAIKRSEFYEKKPWTEMLCKRPLMNKWPFMSFVCDSQPIFVSDGCNIFYCEEDEEKFYFLKESAVWLVIISVLFLSLPLIKWLLRKAALPLIKWMLREAAAQGWFADDDVFGRGSGGGASSRQDNSRAEVNGDSNTVTNNATGNVQATDSYNTTTTQVDKLDSEKWAEFQNVASRVNHKLSNQQLKRMWRDNLLFFVIKGEAYDKTMQEPFRRYFSKLGKRKMPCSSEDMVARVGHQGSSSSSSSTMGSEGAVVPGLENQGLGFAADAAIITERRPTAETGTIGAVGSLSDSAEPVSQAKQVSTDCAEEVPRVPAVTVVFDVVPRASAVCVNPNVTASADAATVEQSETLSQADLSPQTTVEDNGVDLPSQTTVEDNENGSSPQTTFLVNDSSSSSPLTTVENNGVDLPSENAQNEAVTSSADAATVEQSETLSQQRPGETLSSASSSSSAMPASPLVRVWTRRNTRIEDQGEISTSPESGDVFSSSAASSKSSSIPPSPDVPFPNFVDRGEPSQNPANSPQVEIGGNRPIVRQTKTSIAREKLARARIPTN